MNYNTDKIISEVTIRGKGSFALSIAEHLLDDLKIDEEGYKLALTALDKAWEWLYNQMPSGDELYTLLLDEDGDGLILHEEIADDLVANSWVTLTSAIIYVSWLAYKYKGEKIMPSAVHEVDDNAINIIIEFAEKSSIFNADYISRLSDYIIRNCTSNNPNELGDYIDRSVLRNL